MAPAEGCLADVAYCSPRFGTPRQAVAFGPSEQTIQSMKLFGTVNRDDTPDLIQLELVEGLGGLMGGLTEGTYEIAGPDAQYADCGVCVRLFTDANTDAEPPQPSSEQHLAMSGTVILDSLYPSLTGSLEDVTFQQVTIDGETLVSTPVADGCNATIDSMSFSVTAVFQPTQ